MAMDSDSDADADADSGFSLGRGPGSGSGLPYCPVRGIENERGRQQKATKLLLH